MLSLFIGATNLVVKRSPLAPIADPLKKNDILYHHFTYFTIENYNLQ